MNDSRTKGSPTVVSADIAKPVAALPVSVRTCPYCTRLGTAAHISQCGTQTIVCEECGLSMTAAELSAHVAYHCEGAARLLNCAGCGDTLPFGEIHHHLTHICEAASFCCALCDMSFTSGEEYVVHAFGPQRCRGPAEKSPLRGGGAARVTEKRRTEAPREAPRHPSRFTRSRRDLQGSSGALGGARKPSGALGGARKPSGAMGGAPRLSGAMGEAPRPSGAMGEAPRPSGTLPYRRRAEESLATASAVGSAVPFVQRSRGFLQELQDKRDMHRTAARPKPPKPTGVVGVMVQPLSQPCALYWKLHHRQMVTPPLTPPVTPRRSRSQTVDVRGRRRAMKHEEGDITADSPNANPVPVAPSYNSASAARGAGKLSRGGSAVTSYRRGDRCRTPNVVSRERAPLSLQQLKEEREKFGWVSKTSNGRLPQAFQSTNASENCVRQHGSQSYSNGDLNPDHQISNTKTEELNKDRDFYIMEEVPIIVGNGVE